MAILSWRSLVLSTVTGLSLLAGVSNQAQACCFSWLCGCFGGGWGAGYAPHYAGYSNYSPGSYYGGGCSSCGPSYGYAGYGSGYGYGGGYASNCSSCAGGNCGITVPSSDANRPSPDDGFRSSDPDGAGESTIPGRRRRTFENATPGTGTTRPGTGTGTGTRDDGLTPGRRSRDSFEEESTPSSSTFESPLRPRNRPGTGGTDPLETNRTPMPDDDNATTPVPPKKKTPPTPPDDSSFGGDPDAFDSGSTTTNRPVLGEPAESAEPADADHEGTPKSAPKKKAAPVIEIPDEDSGLPVELNQDEKTAAKGVAPRSRLSLTGRFGTPSVVRLKVRPAKNWIAEPSAPVIARH